MPPALVRAVRFPARHWRALGVGVAAALLLFAAATFAGAWYFAGRIEAEGLAVDHSADRLDLVAMPRDGGLVELRADSGGAGKSYETPGAYGLDCEAGYGRLGAIRADINGSITRDFVPARGTIAAEARCRADPFAFADPADRGLPATDVDIPSPLGRLPAWFVDGPRDDWAILIHGQNADRREMLRQAGPLHADGLKVLVPTYRNDEGAPRSDDGRLAFGATEWEDLQAAAQYALDHGARRLVLVGNSMGGSIVMSFLYRSPLASRVAAVVLDAPMLDFQATVEFRAPDGVPWLLAASAEWLTSLRFGTDWDELNYLAHAGELRAPILLFHGTADDRVPIATSEALARARPDLVTFVRTTAAHVRSWNEDPAAYEAALTRFLRETVPPT